MKPDQAKPLTPEFLAKKKELLRERKQSEIVRVIRFKSEMGNVVEPASTNAEVKKRIADIIDLLIGDSDEPDEWLDFSVEFDEMPKSDFEKLPEWEGP